MTTLPPQHRPPDESPPDRLEVTIVVRAHGPGAPTAVRVRRLLKAALRSYRLKCVDIRSPTPAESLALETARP